MGRRVGRWQYLSGEGWQLDGTTLVIDFDRLERCYLVETGPRRTEQLDRYLEPAMAVVESNVAYYLGLKERSHA